MKGSVMAGDAEADDDMLGVRVKYLEVQCTSASGSLTYSIHSGAMPTLRDGEEYLIQLRRIGEVCEVRAAARSIEAMITAQNA